VSVEELIEEVEVEFEYIETVLEELKKLVIKPVDYEPELIEITGAAAILILKSHIEHIQGISIKSG